MRQLTATADVSQGLARGDHLLRFLETAGAEPQKVTRRKYAVISELDDGELRSVEKVVDAYALTDADEPLVFDRVAAAYLQLRRSQTGGLGHEAVDSFLKAAVDTTADLEKAKLSTWIVAPMWPEPLKGGDIVLFSLLGSQTDGSVADVRVRARVVNREQPVDLTDANVEQLLWRTEFEGSRRAGDLGPLDALLGQSTMESRAGRLEWPIAALGLRDKE
jgi:hypothetical protein